MATARDQGRGGSRGRAATRGLSAVRGHRLPAALVMLAVLVAQILGGAALNVSAAKAAETGQLVICTPTGLVQITVDDDGRPLDGDGHLRINQSHDIAAVIEARRTAEAPARPRPQS